MRFDLMVDVDLDSWYRVQINQLHVTVVLLIDAAQSQIREFIKKITKIYGIVRQNYFKGTVSVFLSDPPLKDCMPDSPRYIWNLYLVNNAEDIGVFLGLKVFNRDNFCNALLQYNCAKWTQRPDLMKNDL